MNRNQLIALASCTALLIGLYFFGRTTKPKTDNQTVSEQKDEHSHPEALNIEEYLAQVNSAIADPDVKEKIKKFIASKSYGSLLQEYQKLDKPLAVAHYYVKLAETNNTVESFTGAGDYNAMLVQSAPDEKARKFISVNVLECYQKALGLDSTNTGNRIRLAGAYMEEGSAPMEGVMILLDVVRQDSTNVEAQLMLGRYGLISGQFDKAIARFEKILYLHPQNSEALYLLAQAYNSQGNKQKAIELLEKCRKTIKDAETRKEIDKQIQNIKQPNS